MDVRGFRLSLVAAGALLLGLAGAAPAYGAFGMTVQTASPASTEAGANSDFNLSLSFSGDESVRDLTVHLPPGLVGDPTSTPLCTETQLNADACPAASQIGTSATSALLLGVVPLAIPGEVFNVEPREGEPARLGIVLAPPVGAKVILQSGAVLRQGDFGLDTVLEDIPNTADGVPIRISAIGLSLEGAFMRNPTSCGEKTTSADAVSHADTAANGSNSFQSVNCEALPFSPTFEGKIGAEGYTAPFSLPPQTTVIRQDEGEAGLRRAQVTLPQDVSGNNPYLSNTCTMAEFEAHTCPDASLVGEATAESPLQTQALSGPMALVANPPGLPKLGLDLQGPLALQLFGDLVLLPTENGFDTVVVFNGLPDIPISRFQLTLVEDRLNIVGRDLCEPPDFFYGTDFTSHADGVLTDSWQATIEGCVPPVVDPTATVELLDATGERPKLKALISQGSAGVDEFAINAPPGISFRDGRYVVKADGVKLPASAITVTKRRIAGVADDAAAVRVRISRRGLRVWKSVGEGDVLPFTVDVTDADANEFTLDTPATARR